MIHSREGRHRQTLLVLVASTLVISLVGAGPARAAATETVPLGTADNFAVLAGQGVTNTGPTTVNGDLGTWPNPAITGAGLTVNGATHAADAVAKQAQADTTLAYDNAANRAGATEIVTQLAGQTLTAGVYDSASGTFQNSGTVTLDAEGDANAVFIFQMATTLTTASASTVSLINNANPCNVFWQVGSSASLGANSTLRGTILALASVAVGTGVTIEGRALARNASVTLDTDTITRSTCVTPKTTGTTLTSSGNPSASGQDVTFTATVTATGGGSAAGEVSFFDNGIAIGTATLTGGQATLTTSTLGVGSHNITAVYLGGPGFEASESPTLLQVVAAPTSTTTSVVTTSVTRSSTPRTGTLVRTGSARTTSEVLIGLTLVLLGLLLVVGSARRRSDGLGGGEG